MDTQAAARENVETEKASSFDAIVIGAGVAGLYQLYKLRELGLQVRALEAGFGGWRHLVLEPLPGRALRFRKPHLRLLVFAGASRRMALERAVCPSARDRALSQLCRRQIRPAARHPVQQPRHGGALPRRSSQLGTHA